MPALVHFQRKWLIASDDFVIPFAIEAFLRTACHTWSMFNVFAMCYVFPIALQPFLVMVLLCRTVSIWMHRVCRLVGTSIITWVENPTCSDNTSYIKYFLYSLNGHLLFTVFLCIGIFVISSRGSILEDHKRVHLSKILYIKCFTIILDVSFASFCIWLLLQMPNWCSQWKIFFQAAVVCFYLYVLAVIIGVFICYNSLGSSFYYSSDNAVNSARKLEKAEHVWQLRLKLFCCCADVSEEENDFIYVEISNFLASFSKDVDFTPTDILAGLITLSRKYPIEKRKFKWLHTSDTLLANKPQPPWMTAENALYFLRVAKSTYGGAKTTNAFFYALYQGNLCSLLSPSRCLNGCCNPQNSSKCDDCVYCKSSGETINGVVDNSDILYASFSSLIHEPAFFIAIDHNKKAIVIAIRGTWSFSDLITDIDMEEMILPGEVSSGKIKCHRGALRSALFIQKKVCELQILKAAFTANPSYVLVITGHSLGASIAAILSLLLYPEYPSLQCYSFAPLAVLSKEGIVRTLDFVFSVVVEHDIIPCFSVHSCKELNKQIYKSLEETQFPKYKILTAAFWNYIKKSLQLSQIKVASTSEAYENKEVEGTEEPSVKEVQPNISSNETHLYAPGRILHLRRSDTCEYSWITGLHLQNIIICPSMVKDHQPYQIKFMLESYKKVLDTVEQSQVNSGQVSIEII